MNDAPYFRKTKTPSSIITVSLGWSLPLVQHNRSTTFPLASCVVSDFVVRSRTAFLRGILD